MTTPTARDKADGLRGRWEYYVLPVAVRPQFWDDIEAALLTEREAGRAEMDAALEQADKLAVHHSLRADTAAARAEAANARIRELEAERDGQAKAAFDYSIQLGAAEATLAALQGQS